MAATYPGGIKTFSTKNPGDGILSAHINDLQAEVVAIETELKKTTGSTVDHGGLAGLSHNDHPQYLLTSGTAANSTKLANVTPTAAGLALLDDLNASAQKATLGLVYTAITTLADNTATSITPPQENGFILYKKLSGSTGALIGFTATSSAAYTVLIAGSPDIVVTTGPLTGSTGTDGKLTISTHTDGKIYIENRLGATIYHGMVTL